MSSESLQQACHRACDELADAIQSVLSRIQSDATSQPEEKAKHFGTLINAKAHTLQSHGFPSVADFERAVDECVLSGNASASRFRSAEASWKSATFALDAEMQGNTPVYPTLAVGSPVPAFTRPLAHGGEFVSPRGMYLSSSHSCPRCVEFSPPHCTPGLRMASCYVEVQIW